MLGWEITLVAMVAVLALFAWVGIRARRADGDLEDFVIARNSQGTTAVGLSFVASGLGAWILFAPPEVGAFIGLVGVVGYALGVAAPILAFILLGRRMRRIVPEGHTLTEFVGARFGRPFQAYVIGISIMYMFFFVTAELTAVGGVTAILSGLDPRIAVVAVAAATLAYTAAGGLRASMRTDSWQAWLTIALLVIVTAAVIGEVSDPVAAFSDSGLVRVDRVGIEVAVTLIIAVTAANLFHQGYWQRVWASRDTRSLARAGLLGALVSIPVVLVLGVLGLVAAGAAIDLGAPPGPVFAGVGPAPGGGGGRPGAFASTPAGRAGGARGLVGAGAAIDLGTPPVPFFAVVAAAPAWVVATVIVLGVALVASSVDTLVNGMTALVAAEHRRLTLPQARIVTVLLLVPAVVIAWQSYSVLRLFLIADLLCAATVVPTLLGLWSRATTSAAFAGSVAGLAGCVVPNMVATGSLGEAVRLATFPGAVPTLLPFLGALVASTVVALAVSVLQQRVADLDGIRGRVRSLRDPVG